MRALLGRLQNPAHSGSAASATQRSILLFVLYSERERLDRTRLVSGDFGWGSSST